MVLTLGVGNRNGINLPILFDGLQPASNDSFLLLLNDYRQSLWLNAMGRFCFSQLCADGFDQLLDIGGFDQIIIDLLAYCSQRGLNRGITGEDEGRRTRLRPPHGTHDKSLAARPVDANVWRWMQVLD